MESVKRNTAYKIWIADLISSKYFKGQEQFDAGYIDFKNEKVSRVNIIGSIVDKNVNENSTFFNLDDGSGVLRLRTWGEDSNAFNEIEIGNIVLVMGKVKEYNNYIYVVPEIIRKLDNPLWFKLRKLELVKMYGEAKRIEGETTFSNTEAAEDEMTMNVIEEKISDGSTNIRDYIVTLIEKFDFGDGADAEDVIKNSGNSQSREIINEMIMDGEVFEPHKGKLRVMG